MLDVADDKVEQLVTELEALGLPASPSPWRKNLMACTGIEFCKLSFVETRKRSQALVPELEERLADINAQLDVPVTININGCPNSCARSQIADIGFKGQLVDDGEGNQVEGFQVHLGGALGFDAKFGRKLRQHKVTSASSATTSSGWCAPSSRSARPASASANGSSAPRRQTCDDGHCCSGRHEDGSGRDAMTIDTNIDELRSIAAQGAAELEGASAQELLRWTDETFGTPTTDGGRSGYIVASNMQDGVLVHLAAQQRPGVDVLFLDTGYHFAETLGTRDAVEQVYGVNIVDARTQQSVAEQDALLGKDLFARDPNECCRLRKVVPLKESLKATAPG